MLVLFAFGLVGTCGFAKSVVVSQVDPTQGSAQVTTDKLAMPNIILIMADDMGWGDTGFNGNALAVTPNLDAMAAEGVVFDRFYSAAPVCSPTRGSLLTGRHPFRYGIYYANVGHLPQEEITLPEILREAGYLTGFFGKWHLGTLSHAELDANRGGRPEFLHEYSPPASHGFDRVFATESKTPTYDPMLKPKVGYQETWWHQVDSPEQTDSYGTHYWDQENQKVTDNLHGDDTRVIVDRFIPFIEEAADAGKPFFAVVWTHAPHLPVVASNEDRDSIATDDPYTAHYYGSILAMDREIGRIRNALQSKGVDQDTMVWFTSDNGPEHYLPPAPGSSGGLRDTKRSLYEGGIRVPGILTWPRQIDSQKTLNMPAVTSDILPTILDYLDIDHQNHHSNRPLDGVSLKPNIEGEKTSRNSPIGFESAHQIAYIGDRYKLIHQPPKASNASNTAQKTAQQVDRRSGQNPARSPTYELYDLIKDPSEQQNIAAQNPKILKQMSEQLSAWRASVAESIQAREEKYNHE